MVAVLASFIRFIAAVLVSVALSASVFAQDIPADLQTQDAASDATGEVAAPEMMPPEQTQGATAAETPLPNVPDDADALTTVPPEAMQPEPPRTLTPTPGPAVLQALDKVSAQVEKIEASLDRVARFGTLEIFVRGCQKAPPEEPAESAAFLEIFDTRGGRQQIFSGWMFASSPALSALEHPVYDVWVLDCMNASSSEAESAPVKN
jgi:hypothetical protein